MSAAASGLRERVARELGRPAPAAARALCDAIVERHGEAVSAIVFYGSCLRKDTHEGVLDFYVVVDDYRSAHARLWHAALNALLPPNVYYLEAEAQLTVGAPPEAVRCKYAVLSTRDFAALASPRSIHPYIWARFAQPALLAWVRDEAGREHVEACAEAAIVTLVRRLAPFLPATEAGGSVQRFSLAALWQEAFRRTYRTELRGESNAYIHALYEADHDRYDACALEALERLCEDGWIDTFAAYSGAAEVYQPPLRRLAARLRWHACWPIAKALAVVRLLKTALTFGDWVPYVLWKLERHSGARPELTERQRRHPLIFAWPVIVRVLRQGALR